MYIIAFFLVVLYVFGNSLIKYLVTINKDQANVGGLSDCLFVYTKLKFTYNFKNVTDRDSESEVPDTK